ncbi:MAG: FKBP-type peptidyl-prolyl cis-trans isomerase [Acidiferrobacterales bacterium]
MTARAVAEGCRVTLHFILQLRDGTLVDRSAEGEPLMITIGRGDLAAGLEQCLLGLSAGDKRHCEVAATDAYGPRREENIHVIPRAQFPPELAVEPGAVVEFTLPTGEGMPGRIMSVEETEVTVDFSHPLAGHDLILDVEILAVEFPQVGPGCGSRS